MSWRVRKGCGKKWCIIGIGERERRRNPCEEVSNLIRYKSRRLCQLSCFSTVLMSPIFLPSPTFFSSPPLFFNKLLSHFITSFTKPLLLTTHSSTLLSTYFNIPCLFLKCSILLNYLMILFLESVSIN